MSSTSTTTSLGSPVVQNLQETWITQILTVYNRERKILICVTMLALWRPFLVVEEVVGF